MILGRIVGKLTTTNFNFIVEGDAKKFQYCQVYHKDYEYVLCQIVELEKDTEKTIARCNVIGYKEDTKIRQIRTPLEPNTEVLAADDDFIRSIIQLPLKESAYIGKLEGKDIPVYLDLNNLLTKHIAILAKSGSGKSYTTGVLIEEIIEKKVPLLIIDPHGEYSQLKEPNDDKEELAKFNLKPKSYIENIREYGDISINPMVKPIILNNDLSTEEIIHLLPAKLSQAQQSLLYTVMSDTTNTFDSLLFQLQAINNPGKFPIMSLISTLEKQNLFSANYTPYNELVQPGKASIINLKGIDPEIQEIIVYKLLSDLFEERKKNKIPPFFCVLEESHNFAPERGFGEAKSSKILRTIASEGRKFGLGLCLVTQRPARIDKNVISQCSTQIILRITNPNDLKAVSSSVEGLTYESETEITNLPIGTAMITGIVDLPLFVTIRPRKTKHGGEAPVMLDDINILDEAKKFEEKNILPIIPPKITIEELKLSSEKEISSITTYLIPVVQFRCAKDGQEFNIIVDQIRGDIILDITKSETVKIPTIGELSANELNVINTAIKLKKFSEDQLVSSSPLSPTITRSIFISLLKKDIFNFTGTIYSVNRSFDILFNPESLASYEKIEYKETQYTQKLDKKISLEQLRDKLSNFVSITDAKECFIVYHKAEYKN